MTKQRSKPSVDLSDLSLDDIVIELQNREAIQPVNGRVTGRDHSGYGDEQKALIIIESQVLGTSEAADKYSVSRGAIQEWKRRVNTDPPFAALLTQKNTQYRDDWKAESARTIRALLDYIARATEVMDTTDKGNLRAIAGALKMVGEFGLAVDITYSRLGKDTPQLSATTPDTADEQYTISPVDEIVDGDFSELNEIQE